MSTSDTRNLTALKGIALATTFSIAAAQSTTSLFLIPSILKPLDGSKAAFAPSPAVSRNSSSLNIPKSAGDGRLTPQPGGTFDFSVSSSGTYKAVARQFAHLDALGTRAIVPMQLFALGIFGIAAYRSRNAGSVLWRQWATAAGLVGSQFPISMVFMTPLVHKIRRIGGEEEKIEPYEDAPIDLDAEKSNTLTFLGGWGTINLGCSALMYAAAVIGGIALLDE